VNEFGNWLANLRDELKDKPNEYDIRNHRSAIFKFERKLSFQPD